MLTLTEFKAEMDACRERVVERCESALSELGMSERGLQYVRELKGYPRAPYYTLTWALDPEMRRELGIAVCMHAVGIKLLDDLIDADQPLSPRDQIFGVFLMQMAETVLGSYQNPARVLKTMEDDYRQIWRQQVGEKRVPPTMIDEWVEGARIKAGLMLANYAAVVCLACGRDESVAAAREFAEALGILYMMGDDWMDHNELGEQEGNLAHLMAQGIVSLDQLSEAVHGWEARAVAALATAPTACDLAPFVAHFGGKLIKLYEGVLAPVA